MCVCVVCVCVGAEALYITCKLQNCTDANKGKPFPGYIDPNSLVVQDEYVFVQVGNRPVCSVKHQNCTRQKESGFCQKFTKISVRNVILLQPCVSLCCEKCLICFSPFVSKVFLFFITLRYQQQEDQSTMCQPKERSLLP